MPKSENANRCGKRRRNLAFSYLFKDEAAMLLQNPFACRTFGDGRSGRFDATRHDNGPSKQVDYKRNAPRWSLRFFSVASYCRTLRVACIQFCARQVKGRRERARDDLKYWGVVCSPHLETGFRFCASDRIGLYQFSRTA